MVVTHAAPSFLRIAVRGTEDEMPECRRLADSLTQTYLALRVQRQGMQRSNAEAVLTKLREQVEQDVRMLMAKIERVQRESAVRENADEKPSNGGQSASRKTEMALLQLDLDIAMQRLASLGERRSDVSSESYCDRVRLFQSAVIQPIDDK